MMNVFVVTFSNLKEKIYILNIVKNLPDILSYLFNNFKERNEDDIGNEALMREKHAARILLKIKSVWMEAKKWAWREQIIVINALSGLDSFFKVDDYNSYFIDEFLKFLKVSNKMTKNACMNSICKLLSTNYRIKKQQEIFKTLIDLAKAPSYYDRYNFLLFCQYSLSYFSFHLL